MSYALRNTLILLTTLIIMIAGGWLYINYSFSNEFETLQSQITRKQRDLRQLTTKADDFLMIQDRHARIIFELENHNKELLADNSVATVYDFLRSINRGIAYTSMNFSMVDSIRNADHGIVRVRLDGAGTYRGLFNFMTILEQSKPITRITQLRIAPESAEFDKLDRVRYEMIVDMYYARGTSTSNPNLTINTSIAPRLYNPFFPLIHSLPENTGSLVNVDQSRIVGLVQDGVYLIDQSGQMRFLQVGNEVFLGNLFRVSLNERTASFRLNRGGIADLVVLRINDAN
jgi:hypothetical protein